MIEPELRLRDLGREAEHAVDLPDLNSLQRRGRAMRFRRQASVVAAAVVVAATSVFLFQDRSDRELEPAPRLESSVFPAGIMQSLESGNYEITTSLDASDPTVVVTLPDDWNAAEGPNRFPYLPGRTNQESLDESEWSVALLALAVNAVGTEKCQSQLLPADEVSGFSATVAALRELPGAEVVGTPGDSRRFGYPATQVRVTVDPDGECDDLTSVFGSEIEDRVDVRSSTTMDVWVVDVEGRTQVIVAGTRGDVPQQYADELADVLASVEFVLPPE